MASAEAAALGLGVCVLAAPEIVVGAVIVVGVVVVGVAIKEAMDAYELKGMYPGEARPTPETEPAAQESSSAQVPKPDGASSGRDWFPPISTTPTEHERRPECRPIPGPPRGGNHLHNKCADNIPNSTFPGSDVLVNGKNFDALQLTMRTLWEVKTDDFDKHSRRSQQFFIEVKLPEIQRERRLAEQCGYDFIVGVRSEAHKNALKLVDPSLKVVVMDWC
ncbi:DUF6310 domain-containing protein [Corallococcus coralloides]|uniref:DUF6310 domain-containing protein n=1 Tax=Corallococcus coralloides TaxID=184914 RepID=UPI00307997D0